MKIKTTILEKNEYLKLYNANRNTDGYREIIGAVYGATMYEPQEKLQMHDNLTTFLQISIKTKDDQKTIALLDATKMTPVFALSRSQIRELQLTGTWFSAGSEIASLTSGFVKNDELFISCHYDNVKIAWSL